MGNNLNPLRLSSNRVWRTYIGGRLLEDWQGTANPRDGEFPEDWVASVTKARNAVNYSQDEGLSYVEVNNKKVLLSHLITDALEAMLGKEHVKSYGCDLGILVKLIDSAERLTIQVHPDVQIAEQLFHSRYGKTEAWYILRGRKIDKEPPYILLGFKPGISRTKWEQIFREQDINSMLDSLHKFYIQPGQVFLLEGGIPHAIGPGCFLVEIQEPTDYTIRVERTTPSGERIPDHLCHQGIGFDRMFDCFKYHGYTRQETIERWFPEPIVSYRSDFVYEKILIDNNRTPYFNMNDLLISDSFSIQSKDAFSIIIVISGSGKVTWNNKNMTIGKGDRLFLPAGLKELQIKSIFPNEPLHLIRCFPPRPVGIGERNG